MEPSPLQGGMHIDPGTPVIVTHWHPGVDCTQGSYGDFGGLGLHCGQDEGLEQSQFPPFPLQHHIPNCLHMAEHVDVHSHGRSGLGPGVGGGIGTALDCEAMPVQSCIVRSPKDRVDQK